MYAIEDSVYAFLRDELPPLASFAPERTVLIDSLSKRVAPGLTEQAKRHDARARQAITRQHLYGFTIRADPHAYHCWWDLPDAWRADSFVAAAARRGIAVTPGIAFAVGPGHAPNAVGLALASPATDSLASALDVLAALARGALEDAGVE